MGTSGELIFEFEPVSLNSDDELYLLDEGEDMPLEFGSLAASQKVVWQNHQEDRCVRKLMLAVNEYNRKSIRGSKVVLVFGINDPVEPFFLLHGARHLARTIVCGDVQKGLYSNKEEILTQKGNITLPLLPLPNASSLASLDKIHTVATVSKLHRALNFPHRTFSTRPTVWPSTFPYSTPSSMPFISAVSSSSLLQEFVGLLFGRHIIILEQIGLFYSGKCSYTVDKERSSSVAAQFVKLCEDKGDEPTRDELSRVGTEEETQRQIERKKREKKEVYLDQGSVEDRKKRPKKRRFPHSDNDSRERVKRTKGPFLFYQSEVREQLKSDNPHLSPQQIVHLISEKYKDLQPHEKKKYSELAHQDSVRYRMEIKEKQKTESAMEPRQRALRCAEKRKIGQEEGRVTNIVMFPDEVVSARPVQIHDATEEHLTEDDQDSDHESCEDLLDVWTLSEEEVEVLQEPQVPSKSAYRL